jgi:hypothetical protein
MELFMPFIPDDAMNTSTKYSEFHITTREMEARKFYSLVGILLACVAVLLALGAEPVKIVHPNGDDVSNATTNSTSQTTSLEKPLSLAKSE